jgi:hypothetical protein
MGQVKRSVARHAYAAPIPKFTVNHKGPSRQIHGHSASCEPPVNGNSDPSLAKVQTSIPRRAYAEPFEIVIFEEPPNRQDTSGMNMKSVRGLINVITIVLYISHEVGSFSILTIVYLIYAADNFSIEWTPIEMPFKTLHKIQHAGCWQLY